MTFLRLIALNINLPIRENFSKCCLNSVNEVDSWGAGACVTFTDEVRLDGAIKVQDCIWHLYPGPEKRDSRKVYLERKKEKQQPD